MTSGIGGGVQVVLSFLAQSRPVTLVGRPASSGIDVPVPVWTFVIAALCIAALVGIAVRESRRRRGEPGKRALRVVSGALGLSRAERRLVEALGGTEPAVILISESAFRAAVERWARGRPAGSEIRTLESLAARLGWPVSVAPAGDTDGRIAPLAAAPRTLKRVA